MRQDKVIRRYVIAFMIVLVFGLFLIGNVVADDGPLTVWGQVYDKDGKDPGTGFETEDASVIIMHNGAKTEWKDPDGIERDEENETYVYAVTIDAGAWSEGDIFWIVVDASEWKESKTTCRDHDDTGVNRWTVDVSGGNQRVDVNTGDSNFKPILAIIFIIIIVVVSLLIGLMRPMKMPFSGRPKQPADLVEGMLITGEAVIPEPLPAEEAQPAAAAEDGTAIPARNTRTRTRTYRHHLRMRTNHHLRMRTYHHLQMRICLHLMMRNHLQQRRESKWKVKQ
jgi:hypothetical protein